jgi:hypothetical protein
MCSRTSLSKDTSNFGVVKKERGGGGGERAGHGGIMREVAFDGNGFLLVRAQ